MELTELNLNEDQLKGVKEIINNESEKIRTDYDKKYKTTEEYEKLNISYKELDGKYLNLTNELLELREYKTKSEEKIRQDNIVKILKDNGLNSELAQYLNIKDKDGEELQNYIKGIAEIVSKQQKDFVPNFQHNNVKSTITKEDFNKMSLLEKTKLYKENKDLYNLFNR